MTTIEQLFELQALPGVEILGFDPCGLDSGGCLMDNMREVETPDSWIFDGLIEAGDQVLIAGAPKAGKSLLASQIALAAASGGKFLRWRAARKMRLAYVNLELRGKRFADRILRQSGTTADEVRRTRRVPRTLAEINAFGRLLPIHEYRTLDVLNPGADVDALRATLSEYGPDLVVFDVLARMHSGDEQVASDMKRVMHFLRDLAARAASAVVLHTRKPQTDELRPQVAADIRGSSAVHGEVDLAMILSKRPGNGARYAVTWSARNVAEPPELLLNVGPDLCFIDAADEQANAAQTAIRAAFNGRPELQAGDLLEAVREGLRCGRDGAYAAVAAAVDAGLLSCEHRGRGRAYRLAGNPA